MARQSMVLVASWRGRSAVRLSPSAGARPPILGLRVVSSFSAYDPVEALLGIVVCKPHPDVRNAEGWSRGNVGFPLPRPDTLTLDREERAGAGVA